METTSIENMSFAEYQALPYLNFSKLKCFTISPNWYKLNHIDHYIRPKNSEQMRFGTMFHMYVLQPDLFHETYKIAPKFGKLNTKEGKEAKAEWDIKHPGFIPVCLDEFELMTRMKENIKFDFNTNALFELTKIFDYDGVECKCRIDIELHHKSLINIDLKTITGGLNDYNLIKNINMYQYAQQAAFYSVANDASTSLIIFCDKDTTESRVIEFKFMQLYIAKMHNDDLIQQYRECQILEEYPSKYNNSTPEFLEF